MIQWLRCRGHGFDPWSRESSRVMKQLSPSATITEACVFQSPIAQLLSPCAATPEAHVPQQEKSLR